MMLSMAVLSFLILAANLGVLDAVSHDTQAKKSIHKTPFQPNTYCCFTYHKSQIIQCNNMEDYFETSSECSLTAVIFRTKNRQWLCANPAISKVQDCVIKLKNQANNVLYQDKLPTSTLPLRVSTLLDPDLKVYPGPRDNFFSITNTPKAEVTLPDAETKKRIIYHLPAYFHACCFSYTTRNIHCTNMKDHFKTSGKCLQPAVIFLTREGQLVCTNPKDPKVQDCVKNQRNTVVSG